MDVWFKIVQALSFLYFVTIYFMLLWQWAVFILQWTFSLICNSNWHIFVFLKKTGRIHFFFIIRIELNIKKKTYFFSFEWKNWVFQKKKKWKNWGGESSLARRGVGGEDYLKWWRFGYIGGSSEIFSVECTTKTRRWVKDELTSTSHSKDKDLMPTLPIIKGLFRLIWKEE